MDKLLAYESKGWIGADVSIKDAERLFQTKYHEHENNKSEIRLGCDRYPVPAHCRNTSTTSLWASSSRHQ